MQRLNKESLTRSASLVLWCSRIASNSRSCDDEALLLGSDGCAPRTARSTSAGARLLRTVCNGIVLLSPLGVGDHDRIDVHNVGLHAVVVHRFPGAARGDGPWRRAVPVGPNCCAVCAFARRVHSLTISLDVQRWRSLVLRAVFQLHVLWIMAWTVDSVFRSPFCVQNSLLAFATRKRPVAMTPWSFASFTQRPTQIYRGPYSAMRPKSGAGSSSALGSYG